MLNESGESLDEAPDVEGVSEEVLNTTASL